MADGLVPSTVSSTNIKSFWSRKEGKLGLVVGVGLVGGLLYLLHRPAATVPFWTAGGAEVWGYISEKGGYEVYGRGTDFGGIAHHASKTAWVIHHHREHALAFALRGDQLKTHCQDYIDLIDSLGRKLKQLGVDLTRAKRNSAA